MIYPIPCRFGRTGLDDCITLVSLLIRVRELIWW
jgi:hypothetical protein